MHRIATIVATLVAWVCFGLTVQTVPERETQRCRQYGDLSAECFAPLALVFGNISVVFLVATAMLAILALRASRRSGGN